jgi:hypothetical protein
LKTKFTGVYTPIGCFKCKRFEVGLSMLLQQEGNSMKWSIETLPPASTNSFHSSEFHLDLTQAEEEQLTNMFSEMMKKVEVHVSLERCRLLQMSLLQCVEFLA